VTSGHGYRLRYTIIGGTGNRHRSAFSPRAILIVGAGAGRSALITAIGNFDTVVAAAGSVRSASRRQHDVLSTVEGPVRRYSVWVQPERGRQNSPETPPIRSASSTLQPNGQDTLITLSDNSTIC